MMCWTAAITMHRLPQTGRDIRTTVWHDRQPYGILEYAALADRVWNTHTNNYAADSPVCNNHRGGFLCPTHVQGAFRFEAVEVIIHSICPNTHQLNLSNST